jgi:hypothetical protein
MHILLRISEIDESCITEIVKRFNLLCPEFCVNIKAHSHLLEDNLYSFTLSEENEWQKNHEEILNILSIITPVLLHAKEIGATFEIDICVHLYDYRDSQSLDIYFSNNLLQILATLDIHVGLSVYADLLA